MKTLSLRRDAQHGTALWLPKLSLLGPLEHVTKLKQANKLSTKELQ
jgi:hypothetical protein